MPQEIVINSNDIGEMNILAKNMINKMQIYKPDELYLECLEVTDLNIDSIYNFLLRNYTNYKGRLHVYSKVLLKFYFTINKSILLVLKDKNKQIVAFISSVFKSLCYKNNNFKIYEKIAYVNFLCISNSYRNLYIAPYLITQLWHFINIKDVNIKMSIFHTQIKIPKPISINRYYSRPIDINKLIKAKVFEIPKENTETFIAKLKTHYACNINNLQLIECDDIDSGKICRLLNKFKQKHYIIYNTCTKKYIKQIIKNQDFISLKVEINGKIFAYIDVYIIKEISGQIYNNAYIHNFFYPDNWNSNQKYNFLESIVYFCKTKNVDILTIPDYFMDLQNNNLYLKDFDIKTHIFNYKMTIIPNNKNYIQIF